MILVLVYSLIGDLLSSLSLTSIAEAVQSMTAKSTDRNFKMGFTTWSFGPNLQDVNDTYDFIANNSDVYVEHLDNFIPFLKCLFPLYFLSNSLVSYYIN